MRFAGRHREGRGDRQEIGAGLGERPIKMREPQIVAHRHPEDAPRRLGQHRAAPGAEGVAFPVALAAGEIDVEHVNLIVAGNHCATGSTR